MIPSDNIFLIGLMGAGKTTIGKLLAKHRGMTFFDSDHEIEARCGVSIPTIFEIEGEPGFRRREVCMIDELTRRRGIVLGTGGGAVLDPVNRERLKARGVVIYLRGQPHELFQRTRHDRNRPLLQTGDPLAKMQALYQERHPLYMQTADIVLETGRQSAGSLLRKLESVLPIGGAPSTQANPLDEESDASCADLPLHQIGQGQPGP